MKKLKKLALGLIALITAFSVTAFTACGDETSETPPDNSTEQTPGTDDDNKDDDNTGDNTGGENTPSGGDSAILSAIEKTSAASFKGITVDGTIQMDVTMEATEESTSYMKSVEKQTMEFGINLDTATYNMDLTEYGGSIGGYTTEKGAEIVLDDTNPTYSESESYGYSFIRDGYTFSTSISDYGNDNVENGDNTGNTESAASETEETFTGITDFTGVELRASLYKSFITPDDVAGLDMSVIMGTIQAMPFVFASLAERYDAVTIADNTITVNLTDLVMGIYETFKTAVKSVTADTTVTQILQIGLVKDLIESITVGVSPADIYDLVESQINPPEGESLSDYIPEPAADDTVYEYILDLAASEELFDAIFNGGSSSDEAVPTPGDNVNVASSYALAAADATATEPATFGEMTVGQILTLTTNGEMTVDMLKSYVDLVELTEEEGNVSVTLKDGQGNSQKLFTAGGSIVYTLADGVLSKIEVSTNAVSYSGEMSSVGDDGSQLIMEGTATAQSKITVNFSATAPTLTDISKNPVEGMDNYTVEQILPLLKDGTLFSGKLAGTYVADYINAYVDDYSPLDEIDDYDLQMQAGDAIQDKIDEIMSSKDAPVMTFDPLKNTGTMVVDGETRNFTYKQSYSSNGSSSSMGPATLTFEDGSTLTINDSHSSIYFEDTLSFNTGVQDVTVEIIIEYNLYNNDYNLW